MMRLALLLCLVALPALAQQNPAQSFAKEWRAVIGNDAAAAVQREHVAEAAQALADDWQKQAEAAKKAQADLADRESRLQWVLDNWVPKESK